MQEASVVILAAWAAQNPRLMFNSATDKHPKGLANSSGLLGKYMMAHYASGTWALFDEDIENHMGTVGAQYMSYDRYDKTSKKGAFGSTYIVAGTALKTSDLGGFANARLDLFGPAARRLHEARQARDHAAQRRSARKCRTSKTASNSPTERTSSACRSAKIVHSFDQDAVALWNANFEEGLTIAKATGAKEFWSARGNQPTIHLFGGTIMGAGAGNSVSDSYGQTHEIAQSMGRRPRHVPDRGRVEPDLHDLCGVAARRRAAGVEVGQRRGLIARRERGYFSGSGMNSISSPGTLPKWPAFHSALACSMRSLREETKFHQMWRGPSIGAPPRMTKCASVAALTVTGRPA